MGLQALWSPLGTPILTRLGLRGGLLIPSVRAGSRLRNREVITGLDSPGGSEDSEEAQRRGRWLRCWGQKGQWSAMVPQDSVSRLNPIPGATVWHSRRRSHSAS